MAWQAIAAGQEPGPNGLIHREGHAVTSRHRLAGNIGFPLLIAATLVLSACGRADNGGPAATGDSAAPPAATSPAGNSPSPPADIASPPSDAATTADPSASPQKECQGEPVQYAVGTPYAPGLGEKIRDQSGSTVLRVLHPGEVVTMEFRIDRVSVTVDDKNVVTQVTCS